MEEKHWQENLNRNIQTSVPNTIQWRNSKDQMNAKHWKLIKNNPYLKQILPSPPVIAYRANPSLKKKPVRAKLKPLNIEPTATTPLTPPPHQPQMEPNYPFNIFHSTSQNYRNPIKWHGKSCTYCKLDTKSFATSTTRSTKIPIDPPPPKHYHNCQ